MRLPCTIGDKPALIVGYCQGKRGKIRAIVIIEGELKDYGLNSLRLGEVHDSLKPKLKVIQEAKS